AQWRATGMLTGIGVLALCGAVLGGDLAMRIVFGPQFVAGAPFLTAGFAFAVLVFADQVVQMKVTSGNRPIALTIKWLAACLGTVAVIASTYHSLGAYAGPAGLAAGIVCGWIGCWAALRASPIEPSKRVSR